MKKPSSIPTPGSRSTGIPSSGTTQRRLVTLTIARAKNTTAQTLVHSGLGELGGGQFRLLERSEMPEDWSPLEDETLTVWEATQHLIAAHDRSESDAARRLLHLMGGIGEGARTLGYLLFEKATERGWASETSVQRADYGVARTSNTGSNRRGTTAMTVALKPKLIEVALPLAEVNKEAAREKSIRHGHPSTLHLWWARRPLAAARAVVWASLVDDPSGDPSLSDVEVEAERERLSGILRRLVVWENSNDPDVLAEAKAEIDKAFPDGAPPVLDPFGGGGAIPLEAQRLGLTALSGDLNPVAVLIQKAMLEIRLGLLARLREP